MLKGRKTMAAVDIMNLVKSHGTHTILHDVNVRIADGSLTVLVGRSGCGKSTLPRTVAGLEVIIDGEIRIGPKIVTMLPPRERDIAMVFQSYALYPHMTVAENMGFSVRMAKRPKHEVTEKVQAAGEMLGVSPFLSSSKKSADHERRILDQLPTAQ
jgi:multiple sugar transport system ATP-binding protein